MLLKRFYDEKLAQASYLVGCAATGEALVVDPNRNVVQYLRAAEAEGLRITHVTETHIHADFVSGSRELAAHTGARLYLSNEGGSHWEYAFGREPGVVLLSDGDEFMVGNVRIRALHTPGHTPEHMCFMVTDTAATKVPIGVFTGDFIFAGDVGRPDLLERAAKILGTMEAGARTLYHSLQAFKTFPNHIQLWPGHGAGSACGKALGVMPSTTLGYEKIVNWGLAEMSENQFVEAVLSGQPEPPAYFAEMKWINKKGPRLLHGGVAPEALAEGRLAHLVVQGAVIVDTRSAPEFAAGYVPGTINIPLNKSFTNWAGWLLPYDRPLYLIVDDGDATRIAEAVRDLASIGLDRVEGYFGTSAIDVWAAEGRALDTITQVKATPTHVARLGRAAAFVDVRSASEFEIGHLPGAVNIPLGELTNRIDELPLGRPLVLNCQSGARSSIAASLLRARGVDEIVNLAGGYAAWASHGARVEYEQPLAGAVSWPS